MFIYSKIKVLCNNNDIFYDVYIVIYNIDKSYLILKFIYIIMYCINFSSIFFDL